MKTQIEEDERFVGGNVRPPAAKFKVSIVFVEPFYQRCTRDEQVQGLGILFLAACAGAVHDVDNVLRVAVLAYVSGLARAFLCVDDGTYKIERIQVQNAVCVRSFPCFSYAVTGW